MTKPSLNALISIAVGLGIFISIAMANPTLTPGVWTDITPSNYGLVKDGSNESCLAQGIVLSPDNPSTIYWCNGPYNSRFGGVYKSTDGGGVWRRIGHIPARAAGAADTIDVALHVRINPRNALQMYCGDGVRGGTCGFWVSTDGGENWVDPPSFRAWVLASGSDDIYDIAVDPTDFNHVLVSFHSGWKSSGGGVLETKDGGSTWIPHFIGGAGNSIKFLYEPSLGIGDKNTWLFGTQGDGYWRTTNGGSNWSKVSTTSIQHGGSTIYYTKTGVLYASGTPTNLRSTNNGATWTSIGSSGGYQCIIGDGTTLYTGQSISNSPFLVSSETNGTTWTNYNSQQFSFGPFEMAYDSVNRIMYSSNLGIGVFALKLPSGSVMNSLANKPLQPGAHASNGILMVANEQLIHQGNIGLFTVKGQVIGQWNGDHSASILETRDIARQSVIFQAR